MQLLNRDYCETERARKPAGVISRLSYRWNIAR